MRTITTRSLVSMWKRVDGCVATASLQNTDMSHAVIVVPCYNEARRLDTSAFMAFARSGSPHRLVFVNDGSSDDTLAMLRRLRRWNPEKFGLLNLPRNVGKGEAVRRGLLRALRERADYVGFWDADLATPLSAVMPFCDLLDRRPELEMVFGARVRLLGRTIERRPARHYLGRLFATAASWTLGLPIYDTQCGAKLFRASPLVRRILTRPFTTRWIFDVEIVARIVREAKSRDSVRAEQLIYEFPLMEWRDVAGSKLRARDFTRAAFELAVIYRRYLRSGATSGGAPRKTALARPAVDAKGAPRGHGLTSNSCREAAAEPEVLAASSILVHMSDESAPEWVEQEVAVGNAVAGEAAAVLANASPGLPLSFDAPVVEPTQSPC